VSSYIDGNWQEAKRWIDSCLRLKPNDGPTLTLSSVMGEFDFKAPGSWDKCRALTEK